MAVVGGLVGMAVVGGAVVGTGVGMGVKPPTRDGMPLMLGAFDKVGLYEGFNEGGAVVGSDVLGCFLLSSFLPATMAIMEALSRRALIDRRFIVVVVLLLLLFLCSIAVY